MAIGHLLLVALVTGALDGGNGPIPAFARKYRTSCSTCHTAAPKLNVMGEAFRLNGYRFPENDQLLRKDEGVPLGEEPWKDLWPRAIWPGEIASAAPVAARIQNDVQFGRDGNSTAVLNLRFPHEIYLLAASTLGDGMAAFLETEWSQESGLEVVQAKVKFQHVLPWLGERAANLWTGLQSLYLFTLAERQIDRAARQPFRWQHFQPSDLSVTVTTTGVMAAGSAAAQLGRPRPALEFNGVAGGRLYYAGGVAQGAGTAIVDQNAHKDMYYKLRYKVAGLSLDGRYPSDGGPVLGGGGQLLDRSVTLEHFGYFGEEPAGNGAPDRYRVFGVAGRLLAGRLDLGIGYVHGSHADPWGVGSERLRWSSAFAKSEYLAWPWVLTSVKLERFGVRYPSDLSSHGLSAGVGSDTRLMPGLVLLVRQNVRIVVEGDVGAAADVGTPGSLWIRLDLAF